MEAAEPEEKQKAPELRELAPGEISEAEARKILMDDAMKRGDQQALTEIPLEDAATFYRRWLKWSENLRERNNSPSSGPSNEKRRALREKRKKRK